MKVCLLNESFPPIIDGVANVVMNYANIMQTSGMAEVVVGTPAYPEGNYEGYPYKVMPYKSIDVNHLVKGYRAGNPLDFSELRGITEFGPDIIHTHCPVTSTLLARMIRQQTDAPIIFTYHTKFDVEIEKALKSKHMQKEVIRTMIENISACDEVWVVSKGAGENLRSLGYEGEYRVVDNGVDFTKGEAEASFVQEVTGNYDLPSGVPVFLFVGRMVNYKGLPLIVDALTKVNEAGMDFRMVFVGSGSDEDFIKDKVKSQGIAGKCIFTGAIHDREILRAWNTRADLFLFPSVYDTNGIVVKEAAACGTASVLIEGSCASECVTHGRNGYVIPEEPEAMSSLLLEICQDIDHLRSVGKCAMEEVYISWESCVKKAYESYEEVLENKRLGKYRSHKHHSTQYLYEFAVFGDTLLEGTKEVFHTPIYYLDEMRNNMEEFNTELNRRLVESMEIARLNREEMRLKLEVEFGSLRDDGHEIKRRIKENTKEQRESTQELLLRLEVEAGSLREDGHEIKRRIKENGNEVKERIKAEFEEAREEGYELKEQIKANVEEAKDHVRGSHKKRLESFDDGSE